MHGKWIIQKKEVPDSMAVEDFIYQNTNLIKLIKDLPLPSENLIKVSINYTESLKAEILDITKKMAGASYVFPSIVSPPTNYHLIPLTYNPASKSRSLSSPLPLTNNNEGKGIGLNSGKNSELDVLNINTPVPFIKNTELEKFFSTIKRSIVKSKIVIHNAEFDSEDIRSQLVWHKDGSIFFNLRILIPIVSSDIFGIEFVAPDATGRDQIESFSFEDNYLYTFDTHRPHRYLCKKVSKDVRIGLVIGICPWFDYDPIQERWISNEFYGKKHPFQMLRDGDILPFSYGKRK